ncbi:hypothetical protein DBO86_01095 [Pseudomonas indoloxydans]|uniref:Uncharacterized protein n=1 Tax=Ectopseudomonas oleovorans TaxID=301 RepID=A0A2T5PST1_ECTOL|nr:MULTISPECIES: hypothetical protein [Pseudomonas]MBH3339872.1 hypothetical protein [Pseudomonas mendocina]PTU80794.1 hypothetical protein DBO86_01095 [Pseudomonas indoloxydans]CAE6934048.1 conserved membrane protein of unknown function [Pseudomonas oleovorans]
MLEFALAIVFMLTAAALLGHIAHVHASPEKLAWYLQVTDWKAQHYTMALFVGLLLVLYAITGISQLTGWKPQQPIGLFLLAATCITAAAYLWFYWDLTPKAAKYKSLLKAIGALLTVCIATTSKIHSDMAIAELTGLPAQELPGAQLFLTFILTPTIWFLAISFVVGCISIPLTLLLLIWGIYKDWKKDKGSKFDFASARHVCAWVAMTYFSIIMLTMSSGILKKNFYEKRLNNAIAYSAFLLPPSYCGLPDIKGGSIAVMKYKRAALALPDEKMGYTFSKIACDPLQKSPEQLVSELGAKSPPIGLTQAQ